MLPSRCSLQKHDKKVELITQDSCAVAKYEEGHELGQGFKFDFEKTTKLLLKNHDLLHTTSERQAELSSSINGAILERSLGFAAAGIKLIDIGYKDPLSKEYAKFPTVDLCLAQSEERRFAYEIVLAKDNSNTCKNFDLLHS